MLNDIQLTQTTTKAIVIRHFVNPNTNVNNFDDPAISKENDESNIECSRRTYKRACKNKNAPIISPNVTSKIKLKAPLKVLEMDKPSSYSSHIQNEETKLSNGKEELPKDQTLENENEFSSEAIASKARLPKETLFSEILEHNDTINNTSSKISRMQLRKKFCNQLKALKTELVAMESAPTQKTSKMDSMHDSSFSELLESNLKKASNAETPLDAIPECKQLESAERSQPKKVSSSKLKKHNLLPFSETCVEDSKLKEISFESETDFEKLMSDEPKHSNETTEETRLEEKVKANPVGQHQTRSCRVLLKRLVNNDKVLDTAKISPKKRLNQRLQPKRASKATKKKKEIVVNNVQTESLTFNLGKSRKNKKETEESEGTIRVPLDDAFKSEGINKVAEKSEDKYENPLNDALKSERRREENNDPEKKVEKVEAPLDDLFKVMDTNFETQDPWDSLLNLKNVKQIEKREAKETRLSQKNNQNPEKFKQKKGNKKVKSFQHLTLEENNVLKENDNIGVTGKIPPTVEVLSNEIYSETMGKETEIENEKQESSFPTKNEFQIGQSKNKKKTFKEKENPKLKSLSSSHSINNELQDIDIEVPRHVCQQQYISSIEIDEEKEIGINSVNSQNLFIQNENNDIDDDDELVRYKNHEPFGKSKENEIIKQKMKENSTVSLVDTVEKMAVANQDIKLENFYLKSFKDELKAKRSNVLNKLNFDVNLNESLNKKKRSLKMKRDYNRKTRRVSKESKSKQKSEYKDEQDKKKLQKFNDKSLPLSDSNQKKSQSIKKPIKEGNKNDEQKSQRSLFIDKCDTNIFNLKNLNDSDSDDLKRSYSKNYENENVQNATSKWLESINKSTLLKNPLNFSKSKSKVIDEFNKITSNERFERFDIYKRPLEIDKEDNLKFHDHLFETPHPSDSSISSIQINPLNIHARKSHINEFTSNDQFSTDMTVPMDFNLIEKDEHLNINKKIVDDSKQNYLNWMNARNSTPNIDKKCNSFPLAHTSYRNDLRNDINSKNFYETEEKPYLSTTNTFEDSILQTGFYDTSSVDSSQCYENKSMNSTQKYSSGFSSASNIDFTSEDFHDWDEEFMDMQSTVTNNIPKRYEHSSPVYESIPTAIKLFKPEYVSNNMFKNWSPRLKPNSFVSFYSFEDRCMNYMPWKLRKIDLPPLEVNNPVRLETLILNEVYDDPRLDKYKQTVPSFIRKLLHQKLNEQNKLFLLKTLHNSIWYQNLSDNDKQRVSKLLLFNLMRCLVFFHKRCEYENSKLKFNLDSLRNSEEINRLLDILNLTVTENGEIISCTTFTYHGHEQPIQNYNLNILNPESPLLHQNSEFIIRNSFLQREQPNIQNQEHNKTPCYNRDSYPRYSEDNILSGR